MASSCGHEDHHLSGHLRADPNGRVAVVEELLPVGQHLVAEVVEAAHQSVGPHQARLLVAVVEAAGQTSNLPRERARHRQ